MGFLDKIKAKFKDDWCENCSCQMDLQKKQLFALPMTVGHYVEHDDPNYFLQNMMLVKKKADIPAGVYAAGTYIYKCPKCQREVVKVTVFLPVRDQEQVDGVHLFENDDLKNFILTQK